MFVGNRVLNGNNTGSGGAAIRNFSGNVTVANSTFTGNSVAGGYVFGTVLHNYGEVVTFINDTVVGNTGTAGVGVLSNFTTGGTFFLKNTIIANNSLPNCAAFFALLDGGHNIQYPGTSCSATITSVDPLLGSLADNGGTTKTFALLPGSPAIDAGDNAICAASPVNNFDQRGYIRPVDGDGNGTTICDIGAYERLSPVPTVTPTATPTSTATSSTTPTVTPSPTTTPSSTATPLFHPDTIGIYLNGVFYLRNSNSAGAVDIVVPYGIAGNLPIAGDWDGDGVDTIGVYIVELGVFSLRDSNTPGTPDHALVMGNPGDEPIAGKWDNTMTHDGVGVYRPSNGLLFGKRALTNGYADYTMVLGNPGDHGIAGDWDGNGYDSIGVYRPSVTRFYLANQMGGTTTTPAIIFDNYNFAVAPSTLTPIAGDWTGSGVSRVGYVLNGTFYLKNSFTDGPGESVFAYGVPGALPVTGKWTKSSGNSIIGTVLPPVRQTPTATPKDGTGQFD